MDRPDFATYYRLRADSELLESAADWELLVDDAKSALVAETAHRGLAMEKTAEEARIDAVDYRDLVTIRQYRDLSEAIVARAVVESAGIFCFLKDENFVRLDWQMSNLIGGIRLQVSASDVETAEAVLSQPIPASIALPDQPDFDQPRCPRCNSIDIKWERNGRRGAALFSLYFLSLPLPRGPESWHCNSCGLRWVEEDDPAQATVESDQ